MWGAINRQIATQLTILWWSLFLHCTEVLKSTLPKQVPTRILTVSYNKPLSPLGPAWLNLCQTGKQKVQTKPIYLFFRDLQQTDKTTTRHRRSDTCTGKDDVRSAAWERSSEGNGARTRAGNTPGGCNEEKFTHSSFQLMMQERHCHEGKFLLFHSCSCLQK